MQAVRGHGHLRRGPGRGDDPGRRRPLLQLIESQGAEPGHVDFWGKRRLAYEIKHRWEGYYVVLQAKAEPAAMDELHRTLSLADEVIRHKVLRIPEQVYGPPKVAGGAAADHSLGRRSMANDTQPSPSSGTSPATPRSATPPSGAAKATFGVAVSRRGRTARRNEWEEQTSFFNVVCWREMAENVAESLRQGHARRRHRPPRAAQLGDRAGREAQRRRDRRRRGRPEPALGDRRGAPQRAQRSAAAVAAVAAAAAAAAGGRRRRRRRAGGGSTATTTSAKSRSEQ